jgi:hypothetical protein
MNQIRHPDTGEILEEYDDKAFAELMQECINRRILEYKAATQTEKHSIGAPRPGCTGPN